MKSDTTLPPLTGTVLEEETQLSLAELSRACAVDANFIVELVGEGVLAPAGGEPQGWRFTGAHVRRVTVAVRLHRDLDINLAGVALALQLLDEIAALRARSEGS